MPSPAKQNDIKPHYALFASLWAVAIVAVLIIIKAYAYYLSGSAAMMGTLSDSIVDALTSIMLFFAVRMSLKPADASHRFGHGKVEGLASLIQGALMSGAGLFLTMEAFERFINPVEVTHHKISIIVALIAVILSLLVVIVQKYVLKYAPSLAIEADHAHYKTDIILNMGVALAIAVNFYGGPQWLDPVFALLIAAYFFTTSWYITKKSVDMLMDREMPDELRQNIEKIVDDFPDIHGMHDLRTRMSGMNLYISFDVELSPDLTLHDAHEIVRNLDHKILEHYPNAEILIHMDPLGDTDDPRHNL